MSDLHAYRADEPLAEALREHKARDREFAERIAEFDRAHPGHDLLWVHGGWSANKKAVGFVDGETEVPPGLSRSQKRTELIPKRGAAGQEWREHLEWANTRPKLDSVFRQFGVPCSADGPYEQDLSHRIAATQYADTGADGVIVFNSYELRSERRSQKNPDEPLTEHLTPIPLSEFYAIKERYEASAEPAEAGR